MIKKPEILSDEEIKREWDKAWKKQNISADLDDEQLEVLRDIIDYCYKEMLQKFNKVVKLYCGTIDLCLPLILEEASNEGRDTKEMTEILAQRLKEELEASIQQSRVYKTSVEEG